MNALDKMLADPVTLTARAVAQGVQEGRLSAEALTETFLARAEALEPQLRAFAHLDRLGALDAAAVVDKSPKGALAGVPLGIKDVIDTADMPTTHGSAIYAGHRPGRDASVVHLARSAGAVALGKTVTTEFATMSPGPTRNPHDPGHTPGGSSSGSAAALAAGICLLAFGTQTSGSTIRPAAYCGVVGLKVGPGRIDRTGVKTLAESLDIVGLMARDLRDVALLASVAARRPDWARPEPVMPRSALFLPQQSGAALSASSAARLEDLARLLGAGATRQPAWWQGLGEAQDRVFAWEAAASLGWERDCRAAEMTEISRGFTARQAALASAEGHGAGLAARDAALADLEALFGGAEVLLTPAAPGEAPEGLGSTGTADFNIRWTLLGLPALTLPCGAGAAGLPLGVQIVARPGQEAALLGWAAALEDRLKAEGLGPLPASAARLPR